MNHFIVGGGQSIDRDHKLMIYLDVFVIKSCKCIVTDIWIIGDSLIRWAQERAIFRRAENLGFSREEVQVHWFGKGGMTWDDLKAKIQFLMMHMSTPLMIVIHVGGNSVVEKKLGTIIRSIDRDISYIASLFPSTLLVWSDILPRRTWRGAQASEFGAMNNKLRRMNTAGRKATTKTERGRIISYDIHASEGGLFRQDGVHLSPVGNDLFLLQLQDALKAFREKSALVRFKGDM